MSIGDQFGLHAQIGVARVAQIADGVLRELSLSDDIHAAALAVLIDATVEGDPRKRQRGLEQALEGITLLWPRLTAWMREFRAMGGRPYMWHGGIFPELDADSPAKRAKAITKHRAALIELLEHYVTFLGYSERDIAGVDDALKLELSTDPIERRVEEHWLSGGLSGAHWNARPPLFPGHRITAQAYTGRNRGETFYPHRNCWAR